VRTWNNFIGTLIYGRSLLPVTGLITWLYTYLTWNTTKYQRQKQRHVQH